MFTAKVFVQLKDGILDPQGVITGRALDTMGYKNVQKVRVGKYITLELEGKDKKSLSKQVDEISEKLLSNPIIENYTFEIEEIG